MENRWSDRDAQAAVERYAKKGVPRDVALRVYTTRLLGADPRLVLHGGGNTSVKTTFEDALGAPVDVICVKGSGWDMATIEPAGLPAVRIEPLRRLRALDALSDEDMVNLQRVNLLDSAAPTPSVETLLHAFLPQKFVDHTHANAIVALTDQADGAEICAEVFGDRVVIVPYVMPGFDLAKKAADAQQSRPDCEGMILLKHGIFSFGETAREAYERMIDLVSAAERRLARDRRAPAPASGATRSSSRVADVAPIVRGLTALPTGPSVLEFRTGDGIIDFVNGAELERYGRAGTVTPDHSIRIKPRPVILAAPDDLDAFAADARSEIERYQQEYVAYFERQNARSADTKTALDPVPRVVLVRGLGLFGVGKSAKDARIAADLAETNVEVITDAESIGRFESITEDEMFDIEYWSLEQAKLAKSAPAPLTGRVVVVTGGAGTIGAATAEAFRRQGAEITLLDADGAAAEERAAELGGLGLVCDVTSVDDVGRAFDRVCETYGGVDVVVSNAGAAWQGRIGDVSDEVLRRSFELNFFAHQTVLRRAVQIMLRQGTGGALLVNVSKQAVNPGPNFGPYGLPKAATLALVRQYAVDYGADGIRACGVNADRIRSGLLTDDMVEQRAAARGMTEAEYLGGNLLHREVTAADVAQAFVNLATAKATTGAIITVDGGNIAAALR